MAKLPPRDLRAEAAKHSAGTSARRALAALRLGEQALELFVATLPAGTDRAEARVRMQRNRHRGRQRSSAIRSLYG